MDLQPNRPNSTSRRSGRQNAPAGDQALQAGGQQAAQAGGQQAAQAGGQQAAQAGGQQAAQAGGQQAAEGGPQQAADRQPQHLGAFSVIPPNQSRRSKIIAMAQKEEEELQRWRETHKPGPLQLNPERLGGGDGTEAEARQRQYTALRCSKVQKKIKKDEMDKNRRREEEEELRKMKANQREKSELLEKKRQQEQEARRAKLQQDHISKTDSFLQRLEKSGTPTSNAAQASSMSKVADQKNRQKSMGELQVDHKRVNQAFLDKLECKTKGMEIETNNCFSQEEELSRLATDCSRQQATAGRDYLNHLVSDQEQSCSSRTGETDREPDHDWNLMKLMNSFPDCNKEFLEDILNQCNGDYQQAYTLLISTLS